MTILANMTPKDPWQPLSCSKASWAQQGQHTKTKTSMATFKGTQDALDPRSPTPPLKDKYLLIQGVLWGHWGERGGERDRERERERERERGGMGVDQGGGGLVV